MFHYKDTQNETHKNISQKLLTKETDSQKCSTKKNTHNETHKNVPQNETHKNNSQNETYKNIS